MQDSRWTLWDCINIETLSAILTWLLVAVSALALASNFQSVSNLQWNLALVSYVIFIVAFVAGIRDTPYPHDSKVRWMLMFIEFAAVCGIYTCLPLPYNGILMTIWSGQIVYYLSFKKALFLSVVWSAPLWLTQSLVWHQSAAWLTALLFWTFNLFALVMVNSRIQEEKANARAQTVNRELMATQVLLESAAKEAERTRIARNIHDLLGHHLTALTIHLQVVERQLDGELKSKVTNCHQIARLLLNDVRDAVSDMREQGGIDFSRALATLTDNVPGLTIETRLQEGISLAVEQADTLLRAVQETLTNLLKHSNATMLVIALMQNDDTITLTLQDNGELSSPPVAGNGIKGMQERVNALRGNLDISVSTKGLLSRIRLPRTQI